MAKMLGRTEAESSLNYLLNVSFGDVVKTSKEQGKQAVNQILENHYENIAALATQLLDTAYGVLKDIDFADSAERESA
jgi:hypothetical protein